MDYRTLKTDSEYALSAVAATLMPAVVTLNVLIDNMPAECVYQVDGMDTDKVINGVCYTIQRAIKTLQDAYQVSVDGVISSATD